jgi:hypothetical protein
MEKRIKATKIEVAPSLPKTASDYTSTAQKVSKTTRQATNRTKNPSSDNSSIGAVAAILIIGFVFAVNFCGDSDSESTERHNRGLKNTFEKVDRGEQLSPAEEKRLNDILFSPTDGDN